MIRSSRERNRSCSPVSCRSRGRIARPPSSSRGQGITASDSEESQKQFARKPQRRRPIPAKTITWKGSITHLVQRLGNTSRATKYGANGGADDSQKQDDVLHPFLPSLDNPLG